MNRNAHPTHACAATTATRTMRRRSPALAVGLALSLFIWLAGCGAGLGGTGTGDDRADLAAFGASSAPLCASPLGTALGCASTAAPSTGVGGTVFLSDSSGTRRARVDGNGIELQLLCTGLQFIGEWGVVAGQAPRFYGSLNQNGNQSLASLTADVLADGSVDLRVFDTSGRLLSGPLRMSRSGAPSGLVVCP